MRRNFIPGPIDSAICLFSDIKRIVYKNSSGACPEDFYYIIPLGGIGELTLTLSLTHHLRRRHKVTIILPKTRLWAAQLWPNAADIIISVESQQILQLQVLEDHSFLVPGQLSFSYVSWLAGGMFADRLIMKERILGFKEAFAFGLGLPLNATLEPPMFSYIGEENGRREKKVLLKPGANFIRKLDIVFWEKLALYLVNKGYEVYFDAFDKQYIEISGVKNIDSTVLEFLSLAMACRNVIMLRSGLSDLLSAHSKLNLEINLLILWHIDLSTVGTPLELWHTPGCSEGYPSSKTWFDCGENVIDIEVNPKDAKWVHPGIELIRYLK